MGEQADQLEVLVTGGAGFLGLALVRALIERGYRVRSLSRGTYPVLESLGVQQIRGDLGDANVVKEAARGCGAVFHVAAKANAWGDPEDFERTNIRGTQNIVDACREHSIRYLVYTSTPSVVAETVDLEGADESTPMATKFYADYPRTKAVAERIVQAAVADDRVRAVMLRPHLIYGPGDPQLLPRLVRRARSGRLKRIGNGENRVDVTHIDDAVRAHLCALDTLRREDEGSARANGKAYFISSGDPIRLWDMVDKMLATQGVGPVRGSVPTWAAVGMGALLEGIYRSLGKKDEPFMTRWMAFKLAHSQWFDLSAAKRDLGYEPKVSNEAGLASIRDAQRDGAI